MHQKRVFYLLYFCSLFALLLKTCTAISKTVRLSSGHNMPVVGLGTWKIELEKMDEVIFAALDNNYRLFDTSPLYVNEKAIGISLKKWMAKKGKREDLFISSKLPPFGNRVPDVEKYLNLSLKTLGLDYLDLYLVHMPVSYFHDPKKFFFAQYHPNGSVILDYQPDHVSTWKEMEKLVEKGSVKAIGLSNFNEEQIRKLWHHAKIKPSNLQVELHAFLQQKRLGEFCKRRNISLTAFSTLGSPDSYSYFKEKYNITLNYYPTLLGLDPVVKIAENHEKTTAQILLRHSLQNGNTVIPKSSSRERLKQNMEIFDFELSDSEMKILDSLDQGPAGRLVDFLFIKGIEKHPNFPFKDESVNRKNLTKI